MSTVSDAEREKLTSWTMVAFDEAVRAGYIVPPWRASDAMCERMTGYYEAGLTPAEAAEAAFSVRH
jgi:hypothetical protein